MLQTQVTRSGTDAVFPVLDCWRIVCALLVVALHAQSLGIWMTSLPSLYTVAHHAVIVFFVISGYSVASAAQRIDYQLPGFLSGRLSRVYSLAVPVVILALLIDFSVGVSNADLYPSWQYKKWWLHLGFNLLFLGELWTYSLRPFSIIPYWSLAYEVWYYLLFAAWLIRNARVRIAVLLFIFLLMGPRLWALLPCWLLGVGVFQLSHRLRGSVVTQTRFASVPSLVFVAAYLVLLANGFDRFQAAMAAEVEAALLRGPLNAIRLDYSRWFLSDTLIALGFCICIWFTARLSARTPTAPMPSTDASLPMRLIQWLAPHTFGIYLLHYTLFAALVTVGGAKLFSGLQGVIAVLAVTACCVAISALAERTRPWWRRNFNKLLS